VPDVVSKLGGRELYGNRARIAVRELVENGADAVRALTAIRTSHAVDALDYHGRVEVSLVENGSDLWIEVKDNGVGMGIEALSGPLVDFGRSAWNDAVARAGRAAANPTAFEPTGRYGIGFFAVFMLGQRVQVISRRYDAAMTDTNVVEFLSGLGSRPIIRAASTEEQSLVGGTTVRVRIDDRTVLPNLFANAAAASRLLDLCQSLFPTIDVDIITRDVGAAAEVAVSANDWERLPPLALLRRISGGHDRRPEVERRYLTDLAAHLTDIRNDAGALVGRVALAPPELLKEVLEHFGLDHTGETLTGLEFNTVDMDSVSAVTVGGAVSDTGLRSMIGVMVGRSTRAARDRAVPLVDIADLQRWVREQIDAIQTAAPRHLIVQSAVADVAALCGLDTGSLGVVQEATGGPLTIADVRQWASRHHEVVLIRLENIWALTYFVPDLELSDTVLCSTLDRGDLLRSALPGGHWPDLGSRYPPELWYSENTTMGRIAIAIAEGWDEDPLRLLQLLSDEDEELVEIGHAAGVAVTESGYRLVRA